MEAGGFDFGEEQVEEGIRLLDLVDDLDAVVWEADPATFAFTYVNRFGVELLGYERADWYAPDFWATRLIHPDDRASAIATCTAAVRERRDHEIEYRAVAANGRIYCLRDLIRVVVGEDGEAKSLRGIMLDVTAERRAQQALARKQEQASALAADREEMFEALRSSEEHYRRLVQTAPYAVCVVDLQGRFIEVNPAAEKILGMNADYILGQHFFRVVQEELHDETWELFNSVLSGQAEHVEMEVPIRRPDGAVRLLSIAAAPISTEGGRSGVHAIARDITDERARSMQQRLLEAALDNLPDAVSITDRNMNFRYTNPAHAALMRYERSARPPSVRAMLPDDESLKQLDEIHGALREERRWSGRMVRRRGDGTTVLVSATIFAVSDGSEKYAFTVMRDAAEEISRDQHLRRVERLASLGTLIGGVAHELNNPLTAVVGFAHLMLMDERPQEDRETLETMAREAERAARIVADLRLVARNTQEDASAQREGVDLNDVVLHVLRVRRYALETRNVRVVTELDEGLPPVHGNRAQLEQVVLNVVVNAQQAMERLPSESERVLRVRTRAGRLGAVLYVEDSGPGIRREHLDRIFDPFFTTKAPGEGTGLGLSLAHSIVAEHGGALRVDSAPGRGAEFILELPALQNAETPESASSAAAEARVELAETPLRVLVVDDEVAIRELLARALGRRGHSVVEAREGSEALRLIDDFDAHFDVIVSDVRMPGLGGEELLALLRERRPELVARVLFITGDAFGAGTNPGGEGDVPVLMKPFQLDEAARLVEQLGAAQRERDSSG